MLKKILLVLLGVLLAGFVGGGGFFMTRVSAFDASMSQVYDIPLPQVTISTDPAVLDRGKHLAESLGGCFGCHGEGGGHPRKEKMGPIGVIEAPNITTGKNGTLAAYSNGELARLIKHGVRKNGTAARFMPSGDFAWWPKEDIDAVISYLRTLPPIDTEPNEIEIGALGKFLDRVDMIPLDHARRIDHTSTSTAPPPAPTKEYGAYIGKLCTGCHGATLSGGPIPGAPPELPVPLNLTPDDTGLKDWTYADFDKLMSQAVRKNGQPLNPFMPIPIMKAFNDTEKQALWAYLQSLPARPFGGR